MRSTIGIVSFALLLGPPACSRQAPLPSNKETTAAATVGLPDLDPALAHRLVAAGALLIDVRAPSEYAERHLKGAINIPVDDLQDRSNEVEKLAGGDKAKPIVVYCAAGRRAAKAKTILLAKGYFQVTNLGGIDDWDRK
jgi:rhodanese-related sulfurtransferase